MARHASTQPRTVRVAAVQAIQAICVEAIRSKSAPPEPVQGVLGFLQQIAADRGTGPGTPELDAYLARKLRGELPELSDDRPRCRKVPIVGVAR